MEEAAAAKEVARVTLRVEVFYELLGDFSGCEAVADALELALGSVDVVDVGELDVHAVGDVPQRHLVRLDARARDLDDAEDTSGRSPERAPEGAVLLARACVHRHD